MGRLPWQKAKSREERPPYRVHEVAEKWNVSDKAVLEALKAGRLRGFRLNRMWLIPPEAVDRLEAGGS
jgi:excisionase family DNA binding protein